MRARTGSGSYSMRAWGNARRTRSAILFGTDAERADVVHARRQALAVGVRHVEERTDGVGHGHEGDRRLGLDEALVGQSPGRGVDHLGAEVARAARGYGLRRDEPGETQRAKVQARGAGERPELARVEGEVTAEVLAIELVAPVHRDGHVPLLLAHAAHRVLLLERGQPVHGYGAREENAHGPAEARRLVLRHAQDVERSFDVHLVRQLGIALAASRQQRGEVKDHVDLVVGRELVEQVAIHDVAGVARVDEGPHGVGQRRQVERDDVVAAVLGQSLEQRPANLAVRARHEDRCFGHLALTIASRASRLPLPRTGARQGMVT